MYTKRVAAVLAVLLCAGCAGHIFTDRLRVAEDVGPPRSEGTLILGEVLVGLTREQARQRFTPADFQAAGVPESDVKEATAVFLSPFRQQTNPLIPAQGIYAIVSRDAGALDIRRNCGPRGCSYGGDAVAVRVRQRPGPAAGPLYVVEAIVEPASVSGDCGYVPRSGRQALHCKSLDAKGWEWDGDVFVRRPVPAPGR